MTTVNNDRGTFQLLAENLALALQPLTEAVSDLDSFKDFMFRLGWEVNSLPSSFTNLAALVKDALLTLESLPENASILEVNDLLTKIKAIYSAIKSLTEAPDGVDAETFLTEIRGRIFEMLLTDYLISEFPELYKFLEMFGIIDNEYHEASDGRPAFVRTRFRIDRIQGIVSNPLSIPEIVYGWGTDDLSFELIAEHLHELLHSLNIPTLIEKVDRLTGSGYQPSSQEPSKPIDLMVRIPLLRIITDDTPVEASISVIELPAQEGKQPGVIIQPNLPRDMGSQFEIGENITLSIRAGSDLSSVFGFLIRPGDFSVRYPFQPDSTLPDAGFGITIDYMKETPMVLFGSQQKSRLEMKGIEFSLNADYDLEQSQLILVAEVQLKDLALVIAGGEQDSLLGKLLDQNDLRIPIPLIVMWSSKTGFHFKGSSGLGLSISPHLKIGGIKIDKLTLELLSGDRVDPDPNFATSILVGISGSIGPVSFSMDGIGLQFKTVFKDGNAGPFQIDIDIVPPHGVGLAINGNGVKGGGFISRIENQYSGVIDLDLLGYSIQALAIVRTDPFLSLLFAIFAQFKTAIQLGAGWKLTKIGGMLGINHTVSHNKIATGIKSGILDKILFPDNIIRDAPSVIANFETVFPVLNGQNIFGPAIQIAYGTPTLITGDVAVILEFPNPFLLSILGKVTSKLPNRDNPIIQINVGILGALDVVNGKAEVYGSLYDSKILDFALSGDMAMAASWGSEKNFIFSIGGFNPGFHPPSNFPPFNAPPLKRLNLAFSSYVTFECYLALTSNTLQIGARVDALFEKGGATISGFMGFDALVQFNPFHYFIDVAAGFSVRFKGRSLASIAFLGFIEGLNPHRIKGTVTFSILWWDISLDVDKTFGDPILELIDILDPWPILREALEQNDSWKAELPPWEAIGVVIEEFLVKDQEADQLIHPLGNFRVSQRVVPLNQRLTKFGSSNPVGNFKFEFISLNGTNSLDINQEYFAPAQFMEYPESEKLNLKSYELMDSGVFYTDKKEEIDFSFESASFPEIKYETILLENFATKENIVSIPVPELHPLTTSLSQTLILAGISYHAAATNSNKLKYLLKHHARQSTTLHDEKFIIFNEDNNTVVKSMSKDKLSRSAAINKLAEHRKSNPKDKRSLNVISSFEVPEVILSQT